ncbi:MAG: UDP-galactopyranose mutase [Lachnospiraceae bacterium]|nr:UDP-galactopyranose mutase [Lachnospiraceae bacterium]
MSYKFVVVGAGLAGLTMAERISTVFNEKVLLIERRGHIGGNVYDCYDHSGIQIQKYGPHTFHTSLENVYQYLSLFTEWREYQHRVMSYVDGMMIPMPIGIESINKLYNFNLSADEFEAYIEEKRMNIDNIKNSEDVVLSQAGKDIYEKFFKNFTIKQWGVSPAELDPSVIARIPFRINRDTRYFTDKYQFQPKYGYTEMCNNMVKNKNIHILLNVDYKEVINEFDYEYLIYTGPLDDYFDCRLGKLRYRSINMVFETYEKDSYQEVASMRFPNDYSYTRITEFKKITGQISKYTTVLKEYPCDGEEKYYPFPDAYNKSLAEKYRKMAEKERNVFFLGRLAEYKYYDMDDVVNRALSIFEILRRKNETIG